MYEYKTLVTRVVDGDTFDGEVDLGFTVKVNVRFRVLNFDSPESYRPKTEGEKIHGDAATSFAKELIEGKVVTIKTYKGDSFGRWLASIKLEDGRDYANIMISEGFEKHESYE